MSNVSILPNSGICSANIINGKWDLLVELRADNFEIFDQILGRIRRIEGIYNTETSILLSTRKA